MGDASGFHDVHVRVNGSRPSGYWAIPTVTSVADDIANTLRSYLWLVTNVANTGSVFATDYTFDIFVRVGDIYTDEQVKSNMVRDLTGVFNVSGISIISSGPRGNPAPANTNTNPGTGTNTNTGSGTPNAGLPAANNPTAPSSTGFLDNLGLGLGVSTPIVLLGGGVLLLLILKK